MKKLNLPLFVVLLAVSTVSFAQQKKSLKDLLTKTQSIQQTDNSNTAQFKTAATYTPGRSVNYNWDNTANLWQYQDTTIYSYNSQGLLSEKIWRNNYPSNREVSTYDAKQRLTQTLNQYWYSGTNQWVNSGRITYTFDQHDNQTEMRYEYYNSSTNQWVISGGYKNILTYNSNNRLIDNIEQGWNSSSQIWEDEYRMTNYIYDSNGNALQYDYHEKNGTAWDNVERYKYTYTIFNSFIEVMLEQWNGSAYVKSDRFTNINWHNWTNDPNTSTIASYTVQEWGTPLANQWNIIGRNNTTYDAYGGSVSLDQDYTGSSWVNSFRYSDLYDTHSHNTGYRNEIWNTGTNNWKIDTEQKILHSYNSSQNITQSIWQNWNSINSNYINYQRKDYLDYKLILGIASQSNFTDSEISVYPNPCSSHFILRLEDQTLLNKNDLSIKVYDLFGKEITQTKLTSQETQIERGNLAPGVYFYSVIDKSSTLAKGKLVVE